MTQKETKRKIKVTETRPKQISQARMQSTPKASQLGKKSRSNKHTQKNQNESQKGKKEGNANNIGL